MTTFAIALKDEVRRLARKEIKAQTGATARAVAQYRRQIAALKRQIRDQDRKIDFLSKQRQQGLQSIDPETAVNSNLRFSARSVKAQRRRTGLSAEGYARLLGVSPLTVYNWENGKTRPRNGQFESLVAIRGLGKREAQAKLNSLGSKGSTRPKVRRRRRSPK
jgi:DNA-binding transcriptional regulator YiaG